MNTPPAPTHAGVSTAPDSARLPGRTRRRRATVVAVYAGLLLAAVLTFASHEWGATAHSLLSTAVIGVVAWHVLSKRRWVRSAVRRRMVHPERALVVVNTALAASFAVVNLSGFPVWLWHVGGVIERVHSVSAIAFMVLVLAHLVLNRRRLVARLRGRSTRSAAA